MSRNQEGEYELVLGTPQLLSIVFIIMVLMGVVFSLGYFMGRNVAPEVAAGSSPRPAGIPAAETRPGATGQPAFQAAQPGEPGEPLEPGQAKITGTVPVGGAPTTEAPAGGGARPTAAPSESSDAKAQLPAESPAVPTAAAPYPEPEPGLTFLQVAAVRRQEAELVVDVLKRKGFSARVAPGPSETLFRVLVGPVTDAEQIAKTRKALEEAGFRSAYLRKY